MNSQRITNRHPARPLLLLAVIAAGIFTLVGSGGGGGGDGGSSSGNYSLLPYYAFHLTGVDDPTDAWPAGISASMTQDSTTHLLRVDPQSLDGGFNCDVATENCWLDNIDITTHVNVYDESTPATLFGDFSINILDQLLFATDILPVSGTIQVTQNGGFGAVEVSVSTCSGGVAGVSITDNGTALGCYAWDQFDGLLDSSVVVAERVSNLAFGILEFLYDLTNITALNSFELMDNDLENLGNITMACDSFSGAGLSPPPSLSVFDQGNVVFHWVDDTGEWELGPGDSFGYIFNFCWDNDPADDTDDLYSGIIDLISLTEVVDASDILTRIGYEGATNGKTGGVFFDNFVWYEIESDDQLHTSSIASQMVLNGGMSVVFFEP